VFFHETSLFERNASAPHKYYSDGQPRVIDLEVIVEAVPSFSHNINIHMTRLPSYTFRCIPRDPHSHFSFLISHFLDRCRPDPDGQYGTLLPVSSRIIPVSISYLPRIVVLWASHFPHRLSKPAILVDDISLLS
jgi:hypothetical protein